MEITLTYIRMKLKNLSWTSQPCAAASHVGRGSAILLRLLDPETSIPVDTDCVKSAWPWTSTKRVWQYSPTFPEITWLLLFSGIGLIALGWIKALFTSLGLISVPVWWTLTSCPSHVDGQFTFLLWGASLSGNRPFLIAVHHSHWHGTEPETKFKPNYYLSTCSWWRSFTVRVGGGSD